MAQEIVAISAQFQRRTFDVSIGVFQFPVAVKTGGVIAGGGIRSGCLADAVDQRTAFGIHGQIAPVKQQIGPAVKMRSQFPPWRGIKTFRPDLRSVDGKRIFFAMRHKMDRVVFRLGIFQLLQQFGQTVPFRKDQHVMPFFLGRINDFFRILNSGIDHGQFMPDCRRGSFRNSGNGIPFDQLLHGGIDIRISGRIIGHRNGAGRFEDRIHCLCCAVFLLGVVRIAAGCFRGSIN